MESHLIEKLKKFLPFLHGRRIYYPETKEFTRICWTHLLDATQEHFNPSYLFVLRSPEDLTEMETAELLPFLPGDEVIDAEEFGKLVTSTGPLAVKLLELDIDTFNLIAEGLAVDQADVEHLEQFKTV